MSMYINIKFGKKIKDYIIYILIIKKKKTLTIIIIIIHFTYKIYNIIIFNCD